MKSAQALLILMIDVEGIRKFSSAPHLFGRIVTLEVPWIFHTFQGGLRTAADLKCGPWAATVEFLWGTGMKPVRKHICPYIYIYIN